MILPEDPFRRIKMKKYIAFSLLWISSVALGQAGTTMEAKDAKELQPIMAPSDKKAFEVFTGFGGRNSSWYSYAGTVYAFNGDINSSGWIGRAQIGGGQYSYQSQAIQGKVRGTLFDAYLDGGYKQYFDQDWSLTGYVGAHYRDRSLNVVDPLSNVTSSDKVGAHVGLEFNGLADSFYFNGIGQYSTVENSVWSRLRVGYDFCSANVIVGPEGLYLRDTNYNEYRGGAFVTVQLNELISLSLSGGYANYQDNFSGSAKTSNSSPYGDVGLSFSF